MIYLFSCWPASGKNTLPSNSMRKGPESEKKRAVATRPKKAAAEGEELDIPSDNEPLSFSFSYLVSFATFLSFPPISLLFSFSLAGVWHMQHPPPPSRIMLGCFQLPLFLTFNGEFTLWSRELFSTEEHDHDLNRKTILFAHYFCSLWFCAKQEQNSRLILGKW